jgi:hypothetical protein
MNAKHKQLIITQLESLIEEYKDMHSRSQYDDASDLKDAEHFRFTSRVNAAVQRIAGIKSPYMQEIQRIKEKHAKSSESFNSRDMYGVLLGLYEDVKAGHLESIADLLHGEIFSDFLEMASHLIDNGYKDAAAVVAGSSLEAHLRMLCQKNGIDIETTTTSGDIRRKKAVLLNSELTKIGAYEKLDQKNVTAWLDLRNKAAHGNYSEYTNEQVKLMISGIRDFLTRNPA